MYDNVHDGMFRDATHVKVSQSEGDSSPVLVVDGGDETAERLATALQVWPISVRQNFAALPTLVRSGF